MQKILEDRFTINHIKTLNGFNTNEVFTYIFAHDNYLDTDTMMFDSSLVNDELFNKYLLVIMIIERYHPFIIDQLE